MSASRCELLFLALIVGCTPPADQGEQEPRPPLDPEPDGPPAGLELYTTGDDSDVAATPQGPILLAMGGGPEVDVAFEQSFDELGVAGDVVVLRTSGSDGYNEYLYEDIGGVDSVQTMLVTSRALADDPWVGWRIRHAEVVWLAGGDQSTYVESWSGTAAGAAIAHVWAKGGLVGGTSAGAAVLGSVAFSARAGSVGSGEAIEDPYHPRVTLDQDVFGFARASHALFDTHFQERDRMGRLVAFLARCTVESRGTTSHKHSSGPVVHHVIS